MSFKTDRLIQLLPDAYAVGDRESLLFKLLDTVGAELMTADAKIKDLLKSHWAKYASGLALDGLAAVFGIERRTLRLGRPESDDAFRRRLLATVPLFTGGGTVAAVKGAVRSSLGLPFDLDELKIPPSYAELRADIEALVQLTEFSPINESVNGSSAPISEGTAEALLTFDIPSTRESFPHIEWTFTRGGGRRLVMERRKPGTPVGLRAAASFHMSEGQTLVLTGVEDGLLSAVVDAADVTPFFTNLDGSTPPRLPAITIEFSDWRFRAESGLFDISSFDRENTFGPPAFRVEVNRQRLQWLTFDVQVPFFLDRAVLDLKNRYNYQGELLVYEALPLDQIQKVINQVKAAAVRGTLRFSLNFFETHEHGDIDFPLSRVRGFTILGLHQAAENQDAAESMVASNVNALSESQESTEGFAVGGVFDFATFDSSYGFQ